MNYIKNTLENNYLAHHGVLGQKWGVRRYQNADGSLTNAGKKHYLRTQKKIDNLRKRKDYYYQKALKNEDRSIDATDKAAMYYDGIGGFKQSDKKGDKYHKLSDKYTLKESKLEIKAEKFNRKAAKLLKSLDDQFVEISINDLDSDSVLLGKQFTKETTN